MSINGSAPVGNFGNNTAQQPSGEQQGDEQQLRVRRPQENAGFQGGDGAQGAGGDSLLELLKKLLEDAEAKKGGNQNINFGNGSGIGSDNGNRSISF